MKQNNSGVKTVEGKEISKYNAMRHGVLCNTLLSIEVEEAEKIQLNFIEEYEPSNLMERLLVETMTIAYIRLLRAVRFEQDYLSGIYNPPKYQTELVYQGFDPDEPTIPPSIYKHILTSGHETLMTPERVEELDRIYSRYIVSNERQFYRALHELERIQAIRKGVRPTTMAIDILSDKSD